MGITFEEKQYLGYNKSSLSLRIFMAIFCFVLAWFSDSPVVNGGLLFLLGIVILVISVLLLFVTHLKTELIDNKLTLTRIFGTYRIDVDLSNIISAEKVEYSKYKINYPAYNLHTKNDIRFFTGGKYAVKIEIKDQSNYIIGSQNPELLVERLNQLIKTKS